MKLKQLVALVCVVAACVAACLHVEGWGWFLLAAIVIAID